MAAATNSKFRGRQLLDHEGLSCLLILLFIDDAKLNTTRLHRILRNLCYHAPTRDWVVRCLLSILEKANVGSSVDQPATGGPSPSGLEASATPTPAKLRKSMSGKEKEAKAEKEAQRGGSNGQNSWLNISMDAALGFRANVFQVTRSGGQGGKKSSSSSASISVHPQAAPVVCRHTLEVLISLAKGFPVHFLPGATTASSSGAQTSDSGEAKKQSKPQEFWETLLKLDRECWTSKKGKSVVRSHSSVSIKVSEEEESSSTSLSFSAFGHLLSMLSSPVIKRSSLLTDKLLRLLSLISLGQPDLLKKDGGALEGGQNSSSPQAQLSSVKEEQIQLAVEVLTSKACSEEGLEDVTALLLNLSYGGAQTRESILLLLLAGARQLGNVVSGHVSDLLSELADLKSAGGLAALNKEEEEEGKAKGTLNDRFTKEAVVLVAPTKPKGGGELQLNSMTALTSKTSSQSFFLRVLKVIIQLREAALLAIKKAKKEAEQQQAKKDAEQKKEAEEKKEQGEAATKEEGKEPSSKEGQQSTAMEVEGSAEKELVDTLESLSVQLTLNSLWDTLSNCKNSQRLPTTMLSLFSRFEIA